MKESGICHIAIGEVFCCLASRICCSAVHSHLVDCLILYGQVWVGAKDGFTCLLLLLPATDVTARYITSCMYGFLLIYVLYMLAIILYLL